MVLEKSKLKLIMHIVQIAFHLNFTASVLRRNNVKNSCNRMSHSDFENSQNRSYRVFIARNQKIAITKLLVCLNLLSQIYYWVYDICQAPNQFRTDWKLKCTVKHFVPRNLIKITNYLKKRIHVFFLHIRILTNVFRRYFSLYM